MSATTTQMLSSGEFWKMRYDTIPVKSESANVSFYTNNSKIPVVTLLSQMREKCSINDMHNITHRNNRFMLKLFPLENFPSLSIKMIEYRI
jgi:hypothetical protein